MKRYTDYADQQTILRLRGEGRIYNEIVKETDWSYETIRKVCRAGQPKAYSAVLIHVCVLPVCGSSCVIGAGERR